MSGFDRDDDFENEFDDDNDDDRDNDFDDERDDDRDNDGDTDRDGSSDDRNDDSDDDRYDDGVNDDRDSSSNDDPLDSDLDGGYRFDLVNGEVVNLQEFDDGRWKNERIDRNESWTFDGTNLIQEETKRSGTKVSTYSDPDGDGIYLETREVFDPLIGGSNQDALDGGYRFDLVNGEVVNLQEFDDGRWKNERIDRNECWTFDGTNLIQEEAKRSGTEVTTYSDPNGDGIFTQLSEVFNPKSAALFVADL